MKIGTGIFILPIPTPCKSSWVGVLWAYVGYQLQKYICPLDQDQVAIDIAVTDFPDYVMRMTEEDEHSNSLLTKEYWVFDT